MSESENTTIKNTPDSGELVSLAVKVRENAYAPYSNFRVGAALFADNGKIYTGCNVENASYGAAICAERTAIVKAISDGAKTFWLLQFPVTVICPPCLAAFVVRF